MKPGRLILPGWQIDAKAGCVEFCAFQRALERVFHFGGVDLRAVSECRRRL